jgi:hypothetical protein
MTDTDSLYYLIKCDRDPTDVMHEANQKPGGSIFDLSECKRYKACVNKKRLGYMKEESGDTTIEEMICLCAKMYCLKVRDEAGEETAEIKAKGVPKRQAKKQFTFETYRQALYMNKREEITFKTMRSVNQIVKHLEIHRLGLTADNDKVFLTGPRSSRPLGHWRNAYPQAEVEDWKLETLSGEVEEVMETAKRLAKCMDDQAKDALTAALPADLPDEKDELDSDEDVSTALNSNGAESVEDSTEDWEL